MNISPYVIVKRIRHQSFFRGLIKLPVITYDILFNGKPAGGLVGEIDPFNLKMIEDSINIAYQLGLQKKDKI
jgi:hypothetical protein